MCIRDRSPIDGETPIFYICYSVRNELIIDDTAMERPEDLTRRVLQLADNWPEIERVVDASMGDLYGRGRGGRDRGVGEAQPRCTG